MNKNYLWVVEQKTEEGVWKLASLANVFNTREDARSRVREFRRWCEPKWCDSKHYRVRKYVPVDPNDHYCVPIDPNDRHCVPVVFTF